jgi:hypothetical protein
MKATVECRSEFTYAERPVAVHWQGERLEIEADGPDAAAVLDSLEPLFAGKFGDEAQKSV